jgi:hypothetical protein
MNSRSAYPPSIHRRGDVHRSSATYDPRWSERSRMNSPRDIHHLPTQRDDLLAPATQIVRDRAAYLGDGQGDVGQRIADDKLELFVSLDPAQALLRQFAQIEPDFIALHDVGSGQSLRMLHAVAMALQTKVQTLVIRREGHGVALATLPFIELPGRGKHHLRVYSSDIDADSASRRQLANVLLAHSRLGVLLVGEMPAHTVAGALAPVREAVTKGPWPNRELLMVPLGSHGALAAQAAAMVGPQGLSVRVTPQAGSTSDAWNFVTGAWNRVRDAVPAAMPSPAEAPTQVMPMPAPQAAPADLKPGRWDDYLRACMGIKGLVSACIFDFRTARTLAHHGSKPETDKLLQQGLHLFGTLAESSRHLGLGPAQPDAAITLTGHHLLLHPLPGHPGIILHAVLDAQIANLTLARMQLQRVDSTVLGG